MMTTKKTNINEIAAFVCFFFQNTPIRAIRDTVATQNVPRAGMIPRQFVTNVTDKVIYEATRQTRLPIQCNKVFVGVVSSTHSTPRLNCEISKPRLFFYLVDFPTNLMYNFVRFFLLFSGCKIF